MVTLQGSLFRQSLHLRGRHQAPAGGGEAGEDPAVLLRPGECRSGGEQGQVPLPEREVAQCDGRIQQSGQANFLVKPHQKSEAIKSLYEGGGLSGQVSQAGAQSGVGLERAGRELYEETRLDHSQDLL